MNNKLEPGMAPEATPGLNQDVKVMTSTRMEKKSNDAGGQKCCIPTQDDGQTYQQDSQLSTPKTPSTFVYREVSGCKFTNDSVINCNVLLKIVLFMSIIKLVSNRFMSIHTFVHS